MDEIEITKSWIYVNFSTTKIRLQFNFSKTLVEVCISNEQDCALVMNKFI
ncbi:Uncharacterised protein [uncultured archaeon]|nr:Uncharacterised protein [uncultured archaeon]